MRRKWQGTALFAVIMAGVSVTVASRMLASAGSGRGDNGADASAAGGTVAAGGTTVAGKVEQTQFGPVEVSVTFGGSTITAVSALRAPTATGRDRMLTQYAVPQLEREVIRSQSARVDTISGATYTSQGYLASVQSAIDEHG